MLMSKEEKVMDQIKMGKFLKELRKENGLTQEELAEKLYVNSRSISRWENAKTMPDFDVLIELAKLYDISIEELLNGERTEIMEKQTEKTLYNIAEYTNQEKLRLLNRIKYVAWIDILLWSVFFLLKYLELEDKSYTGYIAGGAFGLIIVIGIVTTFQMERLKKFKKRVLNIN